MKRPHNKERLAEYLAGLIEGKYTLRQVASFTGYTREHLCVLKKRFKEEGAACLVNGHKGKPGSRAIPQAVKDSIVSIYKTDFIINGKGVNFSYFRQALAELYGITYCYNAVCKVLSQAGISSPESRRVKRERTHRPRDRRRYEGELVQIDACLHQWLAWTGDGARYALHGAIDDATSKVLSLFIAKNECSYGYYSVLEQVSLKYGLPQEICSDRSAIFRATPKKKGLTESRAQWQRILDKLGIRQVIAWSPQAKGRIERLWRTLQGRLPFAFKLAGIRTAEEANRFLDEEFIPSFNALFALKEEKPKAWRPPPEGFQDELCSKFERKANGAGVVSFMGRKFLIRAACEGKAVTVCVFKDTIRALYKGRFYDLELLAESGGKDSAPEVLRDIIARHLLSCGRGEGG